MVNLRKIKNYPYYDMIDDLKKSGEWKMNLTMKLKFLPQ